VRVMEVSDINNVGMKTVKGVRMMSGAMKN
jgi:hypothetical protein